MDWQVGNKLELKKELTQVEQQKRSNELALAVKKEIIELISQLPNFITKENLDSIASLMNRIDKITDRSLFDRAENLGVRDFFGSWRLMFLPFWKLSFGWESAYGKGFTWKDFLGHLLDRKENKIKKCVDLNKTISVDFYDENSVLMATASLVKED